MEHIGNLEKFGHYNLTVLCFTAPGDGPRSDPMVVITDEDIPGMQIFEFFKILQP
jgi:protein sidekick